MNIVMFGAPGAGKGTVAKIIAKRLNLPHVSTGDMFREQIKNGTPLGEEANGYMSKGLLVPDELTIRIVKDRLSKADVQNGVILDGFPRTLEQAKELDKILAENRKKVDMVPEIVVPDDVIVDRIVNRATCSNKECGAIFNLKFKKPQTEGKCDVCGSELSTRSDDNEETVRQRLEVYYQNSKDLIEYYKQQGVLLEISPEDPTADNASDIVSDKIVAEARK